MFFPEPKHEWCYYYTQAELAMQMGEYQQAVSLGDEAISRGYQPADQLEWLVFIKAHALTGDLESAQTISAAALEEDAKIRRGICSTWRQVQDHSLAEKKSKIEQILLKFECNSQ
jgi:tetratricopeptide (TPR) repeat protein